MFPVDCAVQNCWSISLFLHKLYFGKSLELKGNIFALKSLSIYVYRLLLQNMKLLVKYVVHFE